MSAPVSSHVTVRAPNTPATRRVLRALADRARRRVAGAPPQLRDAWQAVADAIDVALEPEQLLDGDLRSPRELKDWPDDPSQR